MHKLSKENIQELIHLYQTTKMDKVDIAKKYKIYPTSIGYWLKKHNISIRPRITNKYNKYPFNESFFMNESQKLAYMLGFALGDGSLIINPSKHQYLLSFQVSKKDRYILEMFCNWINRSIQSIGETKSGLCQLRLNNKNIFTQDFSKWGLVPNKTYNGVLPRITDANIIKPFIIGLLDADGSISWKKPTTKDTNRLCLTSSKIVVNWYIDTLKKLGFNGKITYTASENKSWARANITKKNDIINAVNILDASKFDFKMKRKWNLIPTLP